MREREKRGKKWRTKDGLYQRKEKKREKNGVLEESEGLAKRSKLQAQSQIIYWGQKSSINEGN